MQDTTIHYRKAVDEDLANIRALLVRNLATNLSETEKKDGFLSVDFSQDQLKAMSDDGMTIIAVQKSRVIGFLSTQTWQYNLQIPIAKTMIGKMEGKLEPLQTLICGPVCIDREFRGHGVFESMYEHLATEIKGTYSTGLTFVANSNPRSIAAHQHKLGMNFAASFEENGKTFSIFTHQF